MTVAFENNPSMKNSCHAARIAPAQKGKALSFFSPKIAVSDVSHKKPKCISMSKNSATTCYPAVEMWYYIFQFGRHTKFADAVTQLLYAANSQSNYALQTWHTKFKGIIVPCIPLKERLKQVKKV
jgi:hypothetical protein